MSRVLRWLPVLAVLALLPIGAALAAEPEPPTVTFDQQGLPPLACGSQPDVGTLTMPESTRLLVVNDTHMEATVRVGGADVLAVPAGNGALLSLPPGRHVVTMMPGCLLRSTLGELTVTVTAAGPASDPPTASDLPPASELPPAGAPAVPEPDSEAASTDPGNEPQASAAIAPIVGGTRPAGKSGSSPTGAAAAAVPGPTETGPAATGTVGPGGQWREAAAVPVDLSRGQSTRPLVLAAITSVVLLAVLAALVRAVVRFRPAAAGRRDTAQLALVGTPRPGIDDDTEQTNDLRDKLRALVQAAHRGVDPRKVEAARAELFAHGSRPDEHPGT